jgi:hypothetical protein
MDAPRGVTTLHPGAVAVDGPGLPENSVQGLEGEVEMVAIATPVNEETVTLVQAVARIDELLATKKHA